MKSRGMSGFGVIILLIIILVIGYGLYQIVRVHLTAGAVTEKVDHLTRVGPAMSNVEIIEQLIADTKEAKVVLSPESIYIDRSIPDSFRIYVTYTDSSDVFGLFTYKRHFVIDKIKPIEMPF